MHEGDYRELHDTEMAEYRVYLNKPLTEKVVGTVPILRAHIEILDLVNKGQELVYAKELYDAVKNDPFVAEGTLDRLIEGWNSESLERRSQKAYSNDMLFQFLNAMTGDNLYSTSFANKGRKAIMETVFMLEQIEGMKEALQKAISPNIRY